MASLLPYCCRGTDFCVQFSVACEMSFVSCFQTVCFDSCDVTNQNKQFECIRIRQSTVNQDCKIIENKNNFYFLHFSVTHSMKHLNILHLIIKYKKQFCTIQKKRHQSTNHYFEQS